MRLSPRRSLAVWITVCSALVAGCGSGSGPKLEHADGAALAALAHRIAGEPRSARARDIARLQARAIALVNARRVPPDLQEPFLSAVNALAAGRPQAARDLEAWLKRYSR
ncbi:MAG: hypothetical protein ACTHKS_05290 [Gaiellaceae bacterium]